MDKTIIEILAAQKPFLKEKYHISQIGVFGSYARGEETVESDVDILVAFERLPDLFQYIDIEMYLEKVLMKKIDLVEKNSIRSELKDYILQEVQYI